MRPRRALAMLLGTVVLVGACASGTTTTAPSGGPGAGSGHEIAARIAPAGSTAPIDPAAWALADRLTASSYTADSTAAIVAALARAGIATYADPSSPTPEIPLSVPASPLAVLDFQAHALAVGIWTGSSWTGAELDALMPIPAGSTDAAPASVLLASYVAAVDSPGAALARAVMAGQNLLDPPTVRFPALVLFLFASDLATSGGQVAAPDGSPAPSPTAAAVASPRQLADVALPGDGLDQVMPADPTGICSSAADWIHTTIGRLFDALKLAEPSNVIGQIFATIWNFAVNVLQRFVEGVITTVTDAVLGTVRSIAATISGVAEQIASLLPYGVHVAVAGGDRGPDFDLGPTSRSGSYVATITAADLPDWPAILKDCATVAKIPLPDFHSKSIPISWGPLEIEPATAPLLAGTDPAKGPDTTDATGMATWAFTVSADPSPTGTDATQADEMPVAAHRPELTQLRNALTNALLSFVPTLLRGFVEKEILSPSLEKIQGSLNEILDARGYTDAFLHYHEAATPKPSTSAAPSGSGTCTVPSTAGTYQGSLTVKATTIVPPGQIDLGEAGGENDAGQAPLTVVVGADGSLSGPFTLAMQNHFEAHGPADTTRDTTLVENGSMAGTLCALVLRFHDETETACKTAGPLTCDITGKTLDVSSLVPPLPLGAPTVSGKTLTWSISYESGVDAGFGGLTAEVQSTTTVILTAP